ncbi:MAG TPA: ATP-binding cassette domain-containing protein [Candidatus Acidoferrales bacterium]|nr:ATP-binding cassette domain-containing protein [Candidatus Acidoferrales bacterium]
MSLKIAEVSRYFGAVAAVDGVSFEINVPSVVGFLGPNGAGKTTTMRIITGFLSPSRGKVFINGNEVSSDDFKSRSKIGYLPESNPLYTELEVHEYLKFTGELSGLNAERTEDRLDYVADRCGLEEVLYEPIGHLSKGYKQRVGLAQAIIHDPEILILDEPTSGLDPNQVVEIRKLISELAREKFVILSTHILSEVQALCNRVLIINKGKLVLDATSEELQRDGLGGLSLKIKTVKPVEEVRTKIGSAVEAKRISANFESGVISLRLAIEDSDDAREKIFDACVENGFKLLDINNSGSDLEKVFRELTMGENETGER